MKKKITRKKKKLNFVQDIMFSIEQHKLKIDFKTCSTMKQIIKILFLIKQVIFKLRKVYILVQM